MAHISRILSLRFRTKHFMRFTLSHHYTCGGGGGDDHISSDGGKESFISTNNQIKGGGEGDAPKVVMEKKIMYQRQSLRCYASSPTNSPYTPYITRKMPFQFGSCTLCKKKGYSIEFSPSTVMVCLCCRSEFHVHCLKHYGIVDLKELPSSWFCSSMCDERFSSLMQYLENGEQEISDYYKEVIKKKHALVGFHKKLHIRWRILNSKLAPSNETDRLLRQVVLILEDRFDDIPGYPADNNHSKSLIPLIVNGVPIKGQKVVSTHLFRIHGRGTQTIFAELPLGATRIDFEGKGYSQCLLACVEQVLGEIGVQLMVLPATKRAQPMWLNRFRFTKVAKKQANFYIKVFNIFHFDNDLLQKTVSDSEVSDSE